MGEKMSKAPIFFTIGQIRFNPIRDMEKFVDEIQGQFRKAGYVDFVQDELKALQIAANVPNPQATLQTELRWRFINATKTSEYVLFKDSLAFQTTAYDNSDKFISDLSTGISLVNQVVGLAFVETLGIRTLDAVIPSAGENLSEYLRPHLLGFYGTHAEGTLQRSILESVYAFQPTGQLVSRIVILHGNLGLPIDLMPLTLVIKPCFGNINGDHAILDNDRSDRHRFEFNVDQITTKMKSLKKGLTDAFHSAVTETALQRWG